MKKLLILPLLCMLAACGSDGTSNPAPPIDAGLSDTEYTVIAAALAGLVEAGELPSAGQLVIGDMTAAGDMVDIGMVDEGLTFEEALDLAFPFAEDMAWTFEERDMAFEGYLQANTEPEAFDVEDLASSGREVKLLMHETFLGYFNGDAFAGWEAFYDENPDAVGYARISRPFITDDESLAIVHVDFGSNVISGFGAYVLLRKQDGAWIVDLETNSIYIDWVA